VSAGEGPGELAREAAPGALRAQGTACLAAVQFLTVAPPVIRRAFTPAELGGAVGYFPAVGLLVGLVLAGLDAALGALFAAGLTAALLLTGWVLLTGALHLDGFLDSCDGLLGGHTPERRLEIMRDHRVGAYALAGGVLLLLIEYSALEALASRRPALLLAPVLGRWAMSLAIVAHPYARLQGLGRLLKDNARAPQLALATVLAVVAAGLLGGWRGLAALGLAALATWAGARWILRRIPGLTGDSYGALCVLVEASVLVLSVAFEGGH